MPRKWIWLACSVVLLCSSSPALQVDATLESTTIYPGAPLGLILKVNLEEGEVGKYELVWIHETNISIEVINESGEKLPSKLSAFGPSLRTEAGLWSGYFETLDSIENTYWINKWHSTRLDPGSYRLRVTLERCVTMDSGASREQKHLTEPVLVREFPFTVLAVDDARAAEQYSKALEVTSEYLSKTPMQLKEQMRSRSLIDAVAYAWDPVAVSSQLRLLEGKLRGGDGYVSEEHRASISRHLVSLNDVEITRKLMKWFEDDPQASKSDSARFVIWIAAELYKSDNPEIRDLVRDVASMYVKRNDPFYLMSLPD